MSLRQRLYSIYQAFQRRMTPGLQFSQYLYQEVLERAVQPTTAWLDVGCGHQILPAWRFEQEQALIARVQQVVGLDPHLPSLRGHRSIRHLVNADVAQLPFQGNSFDLITANMVVEHLAEPEIQFREVARTLRSGGCFIFHTPNKSGYLTVLARMLPEWLKPRLVYLLQGRKPEDVFPTHYRANSEEQIRALAASCGLRVKEIRMLVSSANLAMIFPLFIFELSWIRLLMTKRMRRYRPYLIAILTKPAYEEPVS
jgi:ubiquinone/menaquinone biosynthesis C-methylase UbiE